MPRDPKIRSAVPRARAASTIARASRRNSSSPRATKVCPFGMVARGEAGGLGARAHPRMWEARRSQRASRESLGPYKDAHAAFGDFFLGRQKFEERTTSFRAAVPG